MSSEPTKQSRVNLRRGLERLWVILTGVWWVVVAAWSYSQLTAYGSTAGNNPLLVITAIIAVAVGPPAIAYLLVEGASWALLGFSASDQGYSPQPRTRSNIKRAALAALVAAVAFVIANTAGRAEYRRASSMPVDAEFEAAVNAATSNRLVPIEDLQQSALNSAINDLAANPGGTGSAPPMHDEYPPTTNTTVRPNPYDEMVTNEAAPAISNEAEPPPLD